MRMQSCRVDKSEGEELKTTSLNIMESADYKIGSSRINNYPVIPVGFAIPPTEGAFRCDVDPLQSAQS